MTQVSLRSVIKGGGDRAWGARRATPFFIWITFFPIIKWRGNILFKGRARHCRPPRAPRAPRSRKEAYFTRQPPTRRAEANAGSASSREGSAVGPEKNALDAAAQRPRKFEGAWAVRAGHETGGH